MHINQIKQILNGWANLALDQLELLPEGLKKESENRFEICDKCPLRDNNRCDPNKTGQAVKTFLYIATAEQRIEGSEYKGCGCNLSAKVVAGNSQCPLGKWLEYDSRNNKDI
tara:strand:+ start:47452 stop:47787 length:336 start_codon:yes stop_codon:yes gene_type:complete